MAKDSFILYLDQQTVFETLTDEQAGQLIKKIFEYEKTNKFPEMNQMLKIAFIPIMQSLDRNREKYENVVERNKNNIAKRWENKDTKNTTGKTGIRKNTKNTDNDNEYDSDNDNESVSDNKEKKKKKKTFQDVFQENNFSTELETTLKDFIDMRKAMSKPMTTKALELLIKNLDKLTNLEEEKIAILNQSIEHSWQTVYPLKNTKVQNSTGGMNDFKELWEEAQNEQTGNNTSNNTFGW